MKGTRARCSQPRRARQPSGPFCATDESAREISEGARRKGRSSEWESERSVATTARTGCEGRDGTRWRIRATVRNAPTWLQDRRRKPDGWYAESEKEGRGRKRELESARRMARGGDGREYYEERRWTKERRRGAAQFSRGSIDASASFVGFRAENADARGLPPPPQRVEYARESGKRGDN